MVRSMDLGLIIITILGLGIIALLLMSIFTKKLHRMLIYFALANALLFGILYMYGMAILASLILLANIGVVVILIFVGMVVGEVVEE